jgi:hypothetical protein
MPTFDWECPKGHQFEAFVHSKADGVDCPVELAEGGLCATHAVETIWAITKRGGQGQYPYVTKHITGKPIEITDAAHESRVMKENGVRKRDDAAWLTQEWTGYDMKTKKQNYKESGAGMPGCWI